MKKQFMRYYHHGHVVVVRKDLRGKHWEHCLCHSCKFFVPTSLREDGNCEIANAIFGLNVALHLVTPVWECPKFQEEE